MDPEARPVEDCWSSRHVHGSWDSPRTRVHAWCRVQGMCSSVSLGLIYNFNSLMAKAAVPSCFKTATIILVPKVTSLTDHTLTHIMICIEELIEKHIISTLTSIWPCLICLLAKQSTEDTISSALHRSLVCLQEPDTRRWMLYSVLNTGSPPVPVDRHYILQKHQRDQSHRVFSSPFNQDIALTHHKILATNIRKDSSQAHNKVFFCRTLEILWFGIWGSRKRS